MLFAKKLDELSQLRRKAVRVIEYKGKGRVQTEREQVGGKGYACGFDGLISFIKALVPSNEVIEKALRKTVPMYPELAFRELVANALIHQDFSVTGAGTMVEIMKLVPRYLGYRSGEGMSESGTVFEVRTTAIVAIIEYWVPAEVCGISGRFRPRAWYGLQRQALRPR